MKHPKPDKATLYQQREAWARWLAKIEREADTLLFQYFWGPFKGDKEITQKARND